MTKTQERNAIYDRLCWILNGVCQCNTDPDTAWESLSMADLSAFISTVDDCWKLDDANCRLMNSRHVHEWTDFRKVAEIIYAGGGRCNQPMKEESAK